MKATIGGKPATSARLELGAWGCPIADFSVDGEATLSGKVSLELADLTGKLSVLAGGVSTGSKRSHFILGAGVGWSKTLPKKDYASDAGVKLSTVLAEAAKECGETIDISTIPKDARVGPKYVRPNDQACKLLELHAEGAWYVDLDGTTRLGRRPTKTIATSIPHVAPIDRALGIIVLAPAALAELVPGAVIDGLEAVDVIHTVSAKSGLRTTLYAKRGAGLSRRLYAERKKFELLFPELRFAGTYECRVISRDGNRVDLQPVLRSTGLPDMRRVVIRPGLAGAKSDLQEGARVLVCFVNSEPGRPNVFAVEDADGEGWKPLTTTIDVQTALKLGGDAAALGCARMTDPVIAGPFAGTIVSGSTKVKVG